MFIEVSFAVLLVRLRLRASTDDHITCVCDMLDFELFVYNTKMTSG